MTGRSDDLGITGNNAYLLTALIIIIVIFASVAVVMLDKDEPVTGNLGFTISLEKPVYDQGEVIPITMTFRNGLNEPTNVSEFWIGGTIYLHLYNSEGDELTQHLMSFPYSLIENRILQAGEIYTRSMNISDYYSGDLWLGLYSVNVTYTNYHRLGDDFDWNNFTKYVSNTFSFSVGWPQGHPALVTFQPIDEDELRIFCEVADSSTERAEGLMHRTSLDDDKGMLFVFDSPLEVSFWMKNTLIPLDIIFITEHGFVTNIEEADPEPGVADVDLTRYQSDGPILYVVEINQGLSATNGIHSGTYVNITYMP